MAPIFYIKLNMYLRDATVSGLQLRWTKTYKLVLKIGLYSDHQKPSLKSS